MIAQPIRVVAVDAHEGPVYVAEEDALYVTTVRREDRVSIKRIALSGPRTVSVVREEANVANGMTLGHDGRLVVCEQGTHATPAAITLVDRATGGVETLVDAFDGEPLNSPNDVVVKRDGTIWFTDPSYGHLQRFRPAPRLGDHLYRFDPRTGGLALVAAGFAKPNGLAFSPGEDVLYVTDSEANHTLAFDLTDDGLTNRRVFAPTSSGHPDGIVTDAAGRVYASCATGVEVFAPDGTRLGEIPLPGAVNFTWGGDVLFITADDAVWAAVQPRGAI